MPTKIKLFAWWTSSEGLTNRFKKQFIGSRYPSEDIIFTLDDDYDYAIVFCWTKEVLKTDKKHTIYFFMEPSWSSNWDREAYKKSNRVFVTSKELFGNYDEFIEHPMYNFYGGHGDEHFGIDEILSYLNTVKPKMTSCVVTNRSCSPLTGKNEGNIYKERVELAQECLKRNLDVDVSGFLWDYSDIKSPHLMSTLWTKFAAYDTYKFSIGIENSAEKNYMTEKLFDTLFFNTVPIYYGAPGVSEVEELKDIVIALPNLDIENNINIIQSLTEQDYNKRINKIINFKHRFFADVKYSLWQRIIKEIHND